MLLFLLSLTGIPPLAGFCAKWYVILAALQVGRLADRSWPCSIVLNAAIAAFYYLRVVVFMYMREPADNAQPVTIGGADLDRAWVSPRGHDRDRARPAGDDRGHCHGRAGRARAALAAPAIGPANSVRPVGHDAAG